MSRAERFLLLLLLLFVFSLAFMQPPIVLLNFSLAPSDFLFLGLASGLALLIASGQASIVLDKAWWFLGAYFLSMLFSAAAGGTVTSSAPKLLSQLYLLSVPVIITSIVRTEAALRAVVLTWIAGAAAVALVGLSSLALFVLDPDHVLLRHTLFHFGTLPPGHYPRLQLTFLNANMACNYLTVSLVLLLACQRVGWVAAAPFGLLLIGILIAAVATISPGLGGIGLALGLWLWLLYRERRPSAARLFLACGLVVAVLFLAAMAFTPILHPTAPFLIRVPVIDATIAPAGRLMIWMDAAQNFLSEPVFGRGIGSNAVLVRYLDPSGNLQRLTDAHNMFLNIAVQCGVVGLGALLALLYHAWRRTLPLKLPSNSAGVIRLAAGLALLNGLVYQGLGGSFEDARHLWAVFGLLLASHNLERTMLVGRERSSG